ncbi:hypothetical protein [Bifidobacterium sp. SMB2]|uniref:hypothetical protein n=1 Tax=Bifidobacterium sp. SMB2 TaxID=2661626 RepID=UPI001EF7E8DA|nr:hypothetical protein [Bifidobacterium sp. SMB2]
MQSHYGVDGVLGDEPAFEGIGVMQQRAVKIGDDHPRIIGHGVSLRDWWIEKEKPADE